MNKKAYERIIYNPDFGNTPNTPTPRSEEVRTAQPRGIGCGRYKAHFPRRAPVLASFRNSGEILEAGRQCCEILEGRYLNRVLRNGVDFPSEGGGEDASDKIQVKQGQEV